MRYHGGGIGHQNQHAKWVSGAGEDPRDDDMDIDLDPELDDNTQLEGDQNTRLQHLLQMARDTSTRPADSDDEDVAPTDSEDSEDTFSVDSDNSDDDSDNGVDDDEPYFGPEDGEGNYREDTGFGAF